MDLGPPRQGRADLLDGRHQMAGQCLLDLCMALPAAQSRIVARMKKYLIIIWGQPDAIWPGDSTVLQGADQLLCQFGPVKAGAEQAGKAPFQPTFGQSLKSSQRV